MTQRHLLLISLVLTTLSPSIAHSAAPLRLTYLDGTRVLQSESAITCTLVVHTSSHEPIGADWRISWSGIGASPNLVAPSDSLASGPLPVLSPGTAPLTVAESISHIITGTSGTDPALDDSALVIVRFPALTAFTLRVYPSNGSQNSSPTEHDSLSTVVLNPGPATPLPPVIDNVLIQRSGSRLIANVRGHHLDRVTAAELVYGVSGTRLALSVSSATDSLILDGPLVALPPTARLELTTLAGQIAAENVSTPTPESTSPGGQHRMILRFAAGQAEPPGGTTGGAVAEFWFAQPATRMTLESSGVTRLDRLFPTFAHADTSGVNLRGEPVRLIDLADIYVATLDGAPLQSDVEALTGSPAVQYACPDARIHATQAVPTDQYFPQQWGLHVAAPADTICGRAAAPNVDIDAPDAWDITSGLNSVKIAILDTGLDQSLVEFQSSPPRVVAGSDQVFCDPPTQFPDDDNIDRHGTAVAGILGANTNNGYGGAGVTWNTKLYPLKVATRDYGTAPSDLSRAIDWARTRSIPILNIGVGFYDDPGQLAVLNEACYNAFQSGHLIVAPMGNKDSYDPLFPAAFRNRVYAVGATWINGNRWQDDLIYNPNEGGGSNRGAWIDAAAPGGRMIVTTGNGLDFMYELSGCQLSSTNPSVMAFGGTSAAAPFVSGVAALLRSVPIKPGSILLGEDLEQIMNRTASGTGTWNDEVGYGRVRARAALDFIDPSSKVVLQGALGWQGAHGELEVVEELPVSRTLRGFSGIPMDAQVSCTRYTLRGTIDFGNYFSNTPAIWPRSSGSFGVRDSTVIDRSVEVQWARVIGTPSSASATLETHVFFIPGHGWYPTTPEFSRIAFTAIGQTDLVGVEESLTPKTFEVSLLPNPAATRTSVRLTAPVAVDECSIELVSISGRRVRLLKQGPIAAGAHVFDWDGRDEHGRRSPAGVYFLRASFGERLIVRKLTLLAGLR